MRLTSESLTKVWRGVPTAPSHARRFAIGAVGTPRPTGLAQLCNRKNSSENGGVLLASLFVVGALGITLGSYLLLVRNDYVLTARSQSWNATMAVAEAGVEEALAQLNPGSFVSPTMVDRSANNWSYDDDRLYKAPPRTLGNGASYRIAISADPSPVIYSTGYVSVSSIHATFTRVLRVTTTNISLFSAGLAVKSNIIVRAPSQSGIFADSFDSADPYHSLNGAYPFGYSNRTKANGDIASLFGNVSLGNNQIQGELWLGPAASGSPTASQTSHNLNTDFPDVEPPCSNWLPAQTANLAVDGVTYTYAFPNSGDYYLSSSSGGIYVGPGANVRLKISANFNAPAIRIAGTNQPGTLKLYMFGASFTLSGDAVVDNGHAANFNYFGLPANTGITFSTNTLFDGTIYAPEADLTINTGYTPPVSIHHHTTPGYYTPFDFIGSCFVNSLTLNGSGSFHFDENLARNSSLSRGYVIASWKEL
jgi:hypothetical protein